VACPSCQEGHLVQGKRGWGCSRWRQGCRFVVWFEQSGRTLEAAEARVLFTQGATAPLEGFSEQPKARLVLDLEAEGFVRLEPVG
jgi:DNA topoisomerase-3